MSLLSWIGAIVALGFLIVVHEAGHFVVARLCGMRVERFSIGFGPGLLKWRSKKGTLFQLAPIPFGGFVEIKGMNIAEDVDPDDKAAYPNRPVWQRIVTIFAGPGTNYLAAVVLAFGLFTCAGMESDVKYYGVGTTQEGYGAHDVLEPGDRIIAIDGKPVWVQGPNGEHQRLSDVTAEIGDREAVVSIVRAGQPLDVRVRARFDEEEKRWRLGFAPQIQVDRVDVGVLTAAGGALVYPWQLTKGIANGLYEIATGKQKGDVGGPVRISEEISKAIKAGFIYAIELLIMLNVYLGLFNLFPLPALDGGRLAFLGYELVTRRRANPKVETSVHMIGILFLLVVMVLVTVKDCRRLF